MEMPSPSSFNPRTKNRAAITATLCWAAQSFQLRRCSRPGRRAGAGAFGRQRRRPHADAAGHRPGRAGDRHGLTRAQGAPGRRSGAWQVLVRDDTEDLSAAIRNVTGGGGVDFVFGGTGKTLFDVSISALHFKGVFVHYGRAGGPIPSLTLWDQPDEYTSSTSGAMPLMSRSISGGGARRR